MATRNGKAEWKGDLKGGSGTLSVGADVFTGPYSFASRFEDGAGTNPEELIAAAHAACFSMALSAILSADGHTPDSVQAQAKVHLRNVDGKPTIQRIDLEVHGEVPGLGDDEFRGYAEKAKADCVVSRALAGVPEIELTVT
jgi:osmotically inducible protein OsmC